MSKRFVRVNKNLCASCGACSKECPRDAINIFRGCYAAVDEKLCVGCGLCARTCPAGCIEIILVEEDS
ncbi:MAG: 4Fe-4S binding protein [Synergistaceae bacterium]|nr:4Fe-4S binding protein [Synergistaceae bacterium]